MSIIFNKDKQLFSIKTANSLYQMKINDIGILEHQYYGKMIHETDLEYRNFYLDRGFSGNPYEKKEDRSCSLDLIPQEYSSSGVGDYRVNSIEAICENGSRSVDFRYFSSQISQGKYSLPGLPSVRENDDEVTCLEIMLKDQLLGLGLKLIYCVYEEKDIITRSAQIINESDQQIKLEKAASLSIDFPFGSKDLIHFHGRHCLERQKERMTLNHNIYNIGSTRGMSSHQQNPFVILCDPETNENTGDCYGFMMVYSGNHQTEVEVDQTGSTRLVMGIHDKNFSWNLKPNSVFNTPEVILSYASDGLNQLSHQYHRIIRENVCPPRYLKKMRPVLINNWEATYFNFNTDKILNLAKQAQAIGIDLFVLDDGWFKNRNDDNSGLGDWLVDEEKLKGGLASLSEKIVEMGMSFGLWFEPEMVNEDSDLFREHPEWVLCDPDRKPMMSRNQLVLDLSRKAVVDYLFDRISRILDTCQISYIKWDFNRSLANVYSKAHQAQEQGEIAHRFMLGTYSLLERLTNAYPHLMIEGCAGGGGRFDAGMLYYSPQIWCSDDTDPIERLMIQKGTSYGYPVSTMGSHVSASPNHQTGRNSSLKTRGIVAMSGTFGYELDLNQLSDDEKEEMKGQIAQYKAYYWLIQDGNYYRLTNEKEEETFVSWAFVSKDKREILLNMVVTHVHANGTVPYVKLKGLDKDKIYALKGTDKLFRGDALMNGGYVFSHPFGDYNSEQLYFVEVKS